MMKSVVQMEISRFNDGNESSKQQQQHFGRPTYKLVKVHSASDTIDNTENCSLVALYCTFSDQKNKRLDNVI